MKSPINVITVGVNDLEKSLALRLRFQRPGASGFQ